mgnify:CR=1 FL=1
MDLRLPENEPYLGAGWSAGEASQRWAMGPAADLSFVLTERTRRRPPHGRRAVPRGRPAALRQRAWIDSATTPSGPGTCATRGFRTYSARLPRSLQASQNRLRLLPRCPSPVGLGLGGAAAPPRECEPCAWTSLPLLARGETRARSRGRRPDAFLGAGWDEPEALASSMDDGPQAELWFAADGARCRGAARHAGPVRGARLPQAPARAARARTDGPRPTWTHLTATRNGPATVLPRERARARQPAARPHLPAAPSSPPADPRIDPRPLGVAVERLPCSRTFRATLRPARSTRSPGKRTCLPTDGWAFEDAEPSVPALRAGGRARAWRSRSTRRARASPHLDVKPSLGPADAAQRVELGLNGVSLATLDPAGRRAGRLSDRAAAGRAGAPQRCSRSACPTRAGAAGASSLGDDPAAPRPRGVRGAPRMKRLGRIVLALLAARAVAGGDRAARGGRLLPAPPAASHLRARRAGCASSAWASPRPRGCGRKRRTPTRAAGAGPASRLAGRAHPGHGAPTASDRTRREIANRIGGYLREHRPRLVIVMAGYNGRWSLAESQWAGTWRARARVAARARADRARRAAPVPRHAGSGSGHGCRCTRRTWRRTPRPAWGGPEQARYPPKGARVRVRAAPAPRVHVKLSARRRGRDRPPLGDRRARAGDERTISPSYLPRARDVSAGAKAKSACQSLVPAA